MKYYKDANNNVYAYEADGSQDAYIKEGLTAITEAEMRELTKPTQEGITSSNDSIIQLLIQEATLQINVLQDTIDLEMTENGEAEKLKEWKRYRILLTRVDTTVEEMELPEKPKI